MPEGSLQVGQPGMWKFQKDDSYEMLEMEPGQFYQPSPIYKGYAVFKILDIRRAEPEKSKERTQYYFDRVKTIKQYEAYKEWVKDFKEQANIKIYITN